MAVVGFVAAVLPTKSTGISFPSVPVTLTVRKNMRFVFVLCVLINSLMNEWMNEWMCNHPPSIFTYGRFLRRGCRLFFTFRLSCSRDSLRIPFS
jgi:hypothetical protein